MSPAWLAALALGAAAWWVTPPGAARHRSGPGAPRRSGASLLVLVPVGALLLREPRVVVLTTLAVGLTLGVGVLVRLRRARAVAHGVDERVRETCDGLADDLAAGASTERALTRSAVDWPALGPVLDAHRIGLDVPEAWRSLASTPGADGLRLVAAAWQVSGRTGQGLSLALRRVAADLRARQASRRVVDSELASARATGRLVAGLPAAAWLMGSGAREHPVAWLLDGPAGWACLVLGGGLLLAGLGWIELLARHAAGS